MTTAGEIRIRLDPAARTGARVSIKSTRPHAGRALVGRSSHDAASTVALLFAVCRHGQAAAACEALAMAESAIEPRSDRAMAVAVESAQEDLRHLLIDVPDVLGVASDRSALARAWRAAAPLLGASRTDAAAVDALVAVASDAVFGEPPAFFLGRDEARLRTWATRTATASAAIARMLFARPARLGASEVRPLGELDRRTVARALLPRLSNGFARTPTIDDEARETGAIDHAAAHPGVAALAERDGNGATTRWFARLVQLATTLVALEARKPAAAVDAWSPGRGEGVAVVRTARGLLLHRARVDDDRVVDYAIIAPTEWNFHPRGAVARGLAALEATDRDSLAADAALVVQLADACVACTLEVGDA